MKSDVSFAIGTGRCGTKFLHRLLDEEPVIASAHEKHPLNDTFHRYCKWYDLPVDHAGFLHTKRVSIQSDLNRSGHSFEASAFLSLSVEELYKAFNCKFILLVRSPEKVINSYIRKGWYRGPVHMEDPGKLPSFQENAQFHHFLGRTLPRGNELNRWLGLTQVGKLAWFWNTLNKEVMRQFSELPLSSYLVMRLEDLSYDKYIRAVAPFIGFEPTVSSRVFSSLAEEKPNSFANIRTVSSWTQTERDEFLGEVDEMAHFFNYDTTRILSQPVTMTASPKTQKRSDILSFIRKKLR